MPRLKVLSGDDVVSILSGFGFAVEAQRGSHAKLRRVLADGTRQTLTIPIHQELDRGTLKAIYRHSSHYIPESDLKQHFYSS
jgi:predicted RNA binding protein YcfA (HicA-like mRNA interferase family)